VTPRRERQNRSGLSRGAVSRVVAPIVFEGVRYGVPRLGGVRGSVRFLLRSLRRRRFREQPVIQELVATISMGSRRADPSGPFGGVYIDGALERLTRRSRLIFRSSPASAPAMWNIARRIGVELRAS
jgi:hypothetical protein